jgi:hypothetical protein
MKPFSLAIVVFVTALVGQVAESQTARLFETDDGAKPLNAVDTRVFVRLQGQGIKPADLCSDEVFVRRVYLDVIGTLPEPKETKAFLEDHSPGKRAALIDALLGRDEFAEYWAMKWCDVLRVKAEFPINLWPNAAQAYHRWVRDSIRDNKPYDQFVRELLTSSGSNFRTPPVNFYRAIQGREPATIAKAVALTFMGTRIENWPEKRRSDMAAFFSRIAYKHTGEWKEEIICLDPKSADAMKATLPDGASVQIGPDDDPRQAFADWLTGPNNPWLARAVVNRVWYWLLGRGIVQEPDDIRPDNPPSNPELLAYLEKELVSAHYDLKHIYRLILNSRTYQQSSIPRSAGPKADALFAYYPVRRLDAEVLIDALCWIGGEGESYTSAIPEPFTFIPTDQRTISLPDGSITSQFLEMFGRPARDTGLASERGTQPTDAQRLYLLSSADVQRKIDRSPRLRSIHAMLWRDWPALIGEIYLTVLSRYPTPDEEKAAEAYFHTAKLQLSQAEGDLAWALINSKEFSYRH